MKLNSNKTSDFLSTNRALLVEVAGLFLLMGNASYAIADPATPAAKELFRLVQTLGFVAVFGMFTFKIFSDVRAGAKAPWLRVMDLLRGLTFYCISLYLIGRFGDELYTGVVADPQGAVLDAAALLICWLIVRASTSAAVGASSPSGTAVGTAMGRTVAAAKPDNSCMQYTAAHEAGHLLVCGALGRLPEEFEVRVHETPDHHGIAGYVNGFARWDGMAAKTFAEWRMLFLLAGKRGEAHLCHETALGSSSDCARWHELARAYLSEQYRGVFYMDPANEHEHRANESKFEAIRAEQIENLDTFFQINAALHREVADVLLEKGRLGRNDVLPFLSRVQIPDRFPKPFELPYPTPA